MTRSTAAGVRIISTGSAFPRTVVTTERMCEALGTDPGWVLEHVGPRERRRLVPPETLSGLAGEAAALALRRARRRPSEVSLIVVATSTPDRHAPSTAASVARALGATHAAALDVNAVCGGFLYAMATAAALCGDGLAIVIGADAYSRITDYRRRDSVFFGDGAGAVLLGPGDGTIEFALGGYVDTRDAFVAEVGGCYAMKGREVTTAATDMIGLFLSEFLNTQYRGSWPVLEALYLHQGSRTLQRSIAPTLPKANRVPSNVELFGNLAAATIPALLDADVEAGLLKAGDLVGLCGFGAGWAFGAALFEWEA